MATTYSDVDVVCPYFREQGAVTVSCEGPTDNTKLKVLFRDKNQKDIYMRLRCCDDYGMCKLAMMQEARYAKKNKQ